MSESSKTNAEAIIDVAIDSVEPAGLDEEGRFYAVQGNPTIIDLEKHREQFRGAPRRKKGSYTVHDADSFVEYLNKHGSDQSEVWADATAARLIGVLNANTRAEAEWEDHRVGYGVLLSDAWKAWIHNDGKLLSQQEFAEHIEDRAIDVVQPAAADMLELSQTFQATMGVDFESAQQLSSGERRLTYRETVDAKAGRVGQLEIPQTFTLGLTPFEGADPYRVVARLRYRIADGNLRIGYKLERPTDVLREAFQGVVDDVSTRIAATVLRGSGTA